MNAIPEKAISKTTPRDGTKLGREVAVRTYLPLGIDPRGLNCLVVGGGRVGTRKALTLAKAGAKVTVVAPDVSPRLAGAARRGEVKWRHGTYTPEILRGAAAEQRAFALVVAATDDPELNLSIHRDCEERGLLSCVVSPGRYSRVIFPAVHHGQSLTVAVYSHGQDCAASAQLRDRIAALLSRTPAAPLELTVVGLERPVIPQEVFAALVRLAKEGPAAGDDFMLLGTCWRWECYFLSNAPHAGARRIRQMVHERCGILLEKYRSVICIKHGPVARLHLLRLACGLGSPLTGETEIIGQIREARKRWLDESAVNLFDIPEERTRLREVLDEALDGQRIIRAASGLRPLGGGWSETVVKFIRNRLSQTHFGPVVVLGLGRFGREVVRRLKQAGMNVIAVSKRAGETDFHDLVVHPLEKLSVLLSAASALVIFSDYPELRSVIVKARATNPNLWSIDLATKQGIREVGRLLPSGMEAEHIARAEMLAYQRVLLKCESSSLASVLKIGCRPSRLSLAQVREAINVMQIVMPRVKFVVDAIETPGDRDRKTPLTQVSESDFFTRDLDRALIDKRIDIAVHSAKDLPGSIPPGLHVAALTPAFAPWECLVSRSGSLLDLPAGARVGTSSQARRKWLLSLRPDVIACEIRGNVPDRLAQLDSGKYDALLLAAAGLIRLGLAGRITQVFSVDEAPPAPGQGALALVTRADDYEIHRALAPLDLGSRESMPWG